MYTLDPVDDIQSHMLGVIAGLMTSYNLNPAQVQARYEYILTLSQDEISRSYDEPLAVQPQVENPQVESTAFHKLEPINSNKTWADYSDDEDDDMYSSNNEELSNDEEGEYNATLFVSTRKQFCDTMQKGIKICPRYSTCSNSDCKNFHVKEEHICQHVTRGSYCDDNTCELIVIRACRKGNKCKDSECSFRHR